MATSVLLFRHAWLQKRALRAWQIASELGLPQRNGRRRAARKRARTLCLQALQAWRRVRGMREVRQSPLRTSAILWLCMNR